MIGVAIGMAIVTLAGCDQAEVGPAAHSARTQAGAQVRTEPNPRVLIKLMRAELRTTATFHMTGRSLARTYFDGKLTETDAQWEHADVLLRTASRHEYFTFVERVKSRNLRNEPLVHRLTQRFEGVGVGNRLAYRLDHQAWRCTRYGDVYYAHYLPYLLDHPGSRVLHVRTLGTTIVHGVRAWHVRVRVQRPARERGFQSQGFRDRVFVDEFIAASNYALLQEEQSLSETESQGRLSYRLISHSIAVFSKFGERVTLDVPAACKPVFAGAMRGSLVSSR